MIRLLQLSDIHFHAFSGGDEDEFRNMRQKLIEDLDYVREHLAPINTILICGDIAFSGQKDQYDKAREFINEVLIKLMKDGKQPNVFTVPGNHDKNRTVYEDTRYVLNNALLSDKYVDANVFFSKLRSSENDTLKILYAPLAEYNNFASEYSSIDEISSSIMTDETLKAKSPTYSRIIGNLGDYAVTLHGINSTLCCDKYDFIPDDARSHKLFIPKMAFNQNKSNKDIFISVVHHPIEGFIMHEKMVAEKFDQLYDIQLFGHIHKQSSKVDNNIKIYSGAFQPDEQDDAEYFPVYNIITLDLIDSSLAVEIKSRKWTGTRFEMYNDGSVRHNLSLSPVDTWSEEEKVQSEVSKQEVVNMDNKYKLQKRFLECSLQKRKSIMKKMGFEYDATKKDISNSVLFIKMIEAELRWKDLSSNLEV